MESYIHTHTRESKVRCDPDDLGSIGRCHPRRSWLGYQLPREQLGAKPELAEQNFIRVNSSNKISFVYDISNRILFV